MADVDRQVFLKTIVLSPQILKEIDENCYKFNFSRSEFIRMAVMRKIEKLYEKMVIVSDPDKIYIGGKNYQVRSTK